MLETYNHITTQTIIYDVVLALVVGIVSSLLTTIILRRFEKQKARRVLLNNHRFMECIGESHLFSRYFLMTAQPILHYYGGIEWFHFPGKVDSEKKIDYLENKEYRDDILHFLDQNKEEVKTIIDVITSEKNDVLYGTINKSLSISYNQELCDISDNLKDRSHNFTDNDLKSDIEGILKEKNIMRAYYSLFDILAYISYLFDLYTFLGVEDKLSHGFDAGLKALRKKKKA